MLNNVIASIVPAVVLIACSTLQADSPGPATEAIRNAIRKSIPLLEKGSAGSAKHRKCFTCHNQGLPVLALADSRGQDKYQEYARWWKKKTEAKPGLVKRDENGKRLGRVFTVPTDPKSVGAEEAERTGIVQGPTFVLGVAIGQHARAYPIHALGFELLNDTLGDVAIAASW